jgi:hypothetical protein
MISAAARNRRIAASPFVIASLLSWVNARRGFAKIPVPTVAAAPAIRVFLRNERRFATRGLYELFSSFVVAGDTPDDSTVARVRFFMFYAPLFLRMIFLRIIRM